MFSKRFVFLLFLVFSTAVAFFPCCDQEIVFSNAPPSNLSVALGKCYISTNQQIVLLGEAFDGDGDPLFYKWSVEGDLGSFIPPSGEGKMVTWVAPGTPGEAVITLTVTDRIDTKSKKIHIDVGETFPTAIVTDTEIADNGYIYLLTNTFPLRVPQGVTLTIGPGVRIVVDSESGGLTVNGRLVVNGTEAEPVRIGGSACDYTTYTYWGEITIQGRNASAELRYLYLYGGTNGVYSTDHASLVIDNCKIFDSKYDGIGIFNFSDAIITNSEILDNSVGINIEDSDVIVRDSKINYNSNNGFYVSDTTRMSTVTIESCVITNNNNYGLLISRIAVPSINFCSIYFNGEYAIRLSDYIGTAPLDAENNFWGRDYRSESAISEIIYDKADSPETVWAFVDFIPWLDEEP